jgi:hypothetical protein
MIRAQDPLAGLVPAIHAFFPLGGVSGEDVGGRNKSGQGELSLTRGVCQSPGCYSERRPPMFHFKLGPQ